MKYGFAKGSYGESPQDGLELIDCRITNAVRCVPPQNLPTPLEDKTCNAFLTAEIAAMPNLQAILTLGTVAHLMSLRAIGLKPSAFNFTHGAMHAVKPGLLIANSYHVSKYNTSTRRLTVAMFEDVAGAIRQRLNAPADS